MTSSSGSSSGSSSPLSSPVVSLRTDRALVRAGARSRRWLLASIAAPEAPPRADRLPVNVALVLDRSGSMAGARKFELARQAVEQALRMLRPEDSFSLVTYDAQVDVLAPASAATAEAKRRALEALAHVGPRGSTDLCAGWLRGCEQVAERLSDDGIARALLLTDGLANHGVTDGPTIAHHAAELRRRGIATSTFGVGEDFDERLLRDMAHEGGGNFYFLERAEQIPDLMTSELGVALETVMRRAALHVQLAPGMEAEPLNRFRHTRARGDDELRVELGDLVSGQELSVVIELRFPRGEIGRRTSVRVALGSDDAIVTHAEGLVEWTYASHADNDRQPRDRTVDREVAKLYAARARAEATEANRHGDLERARRVIVGTVQRIGSYAGDDRELRDLMYALEIETDQFAAAVMSPMAMKAAFHVAESAAKGRDELGRARRR
jgi:Ca-activated chloride channel family protein